MSNKELVARVSEFQRLVADKNTGLANSLEEAIIPLLNCKFDLNEVSRHYLAQRIGRSERTVGYILRIINGEDFESILKDVGTTHSTRTIAYVPEKVAKKKPEEESGEYSNAVKLYEESK